MIKRDTVSAGVNRVIQDLIDKHEEVTASQLVEAARPEDSPAHAAFEWNQKVAAEEYRKSQARRYIRRFEYRPITTEKDDGESETLKVHLYHVPSDLPRTEGKYVPATILQDNKGDYLRAQNELKRQIGAMNRSIAELQKFAPATLSTEQNVLLAQISQLVDSLGVMATQLHLQ